MIEIQRASKHDKGLTIRTSQFSKKFNFNVGDEFIALFDNGVSILFKVNRKGNTLYSGAKAVNNDKFNPKIGRPVKANIRQLLRVTK